MNLYRLSKAKYKDNLSGIGSSIYGARWNSVGTEVIYTASSRALAMSEILVHLTLLEIPEDYFMLTISVPDKYKIVEINHSDLPNQWDNPIIYQPSAQKMGNRFIEENLACLMKVPSAVVKGDFNYLINPFHECFREIKIIEAELFPFDERLFK